MTGTATLAPDAALSDTTFLTCPSLTNWTHINQDTDVCTQIRGLIRDVPCPWTTVNSISPTMEIIVMDVLQQELDDLSSPDGYRTACMKCLRALSKARNIVPSSFSSQDVVREGTNSVSGGGFADIWKGRLHDTQVCLKVLRIFKPEKAGVKALQDLCREALVWRQLHHPSVLPFLGVSKTLFAPRYCLISPWMANGNIMSYLEAHPDHDRLMSLAQVAEGMKYLHNLDPPIVHADIRGANILVMDDLCCCLADFGLSLFAESQAFDSSSRMSKGSIRWLAPEYMDSRLFDPSYITARDIYAYGCTAVEIFTGKPPFSDIRNDAGVMYEVLTNGNRPPRPPLNVFPDDGLWSLVTACLTTLPSERPNDEQILAIFAQAVFGKGILRNNKVGSLLELDFTPNLISTKTSKESDDIDASPSRAQFEGSPSRPAASGTVDKSIPARQSELSLRVISSRSKRCRSSSPLSPGSRSASPTVHTKPENIHLEPSQTNEGADIHHAKRVRVGEPTNGDVLTSPPAKMLTL